MVLDEKRTDPSQRRERQHVRGTQLPENFAIINVGVAALSEGADESCTDKSASSSSAKASAGSVPLPNPRPRGVQKTNAERHPQHPKIWRVPCEYLDEDKAQELVLCYMRRSSNRGLNLRAGILRGPFRTQGVAESRRCEPGACDMLRRFPPARTLRFAWAARASTKIVGWGVRCTGK
jgi:hypothetical protein